MFTRRQFGARILQGSSLIALGPVVPQFIAQTAWAATPGKDEVLVVVEMSGGNDGLNTVIPYADADYHKARPTLRRTKDAVIRLDDHVGLHGGMRGFQSLWDQGFLAVVQGVGYPNPDRSHFEAMDIWQSGDPQRATPTGWLGRASGVIDNRGGGIPAVHIGPGRLPPALAGGPGGGAISVGDKNSFSLDLGRSDANRQTDRRRLLGDLSPSTAESGEDDLVSFVRQRQAQTFTAVENLHDLLEGPNAVRGFGGGLSQKLQIIAGLIARGFGTRIFYVSLDGFDTHADQAPAHQKLLAELADSVGSFFQTLKNSGDDKRVRLMTFSEFGRRVQENGSRGTDHGAASCLFVAGPSVRGGVVGAHPSLSDLDAGDLKFHTDFRRIYATLLDTWLGCESQAVLRKRWDHIPALGRKG